ncbi:MAG: SDR family oxidoreductase [Actinomycetota bacterium]
MAGLDGKVALVSGAAGAIGVAVVGRLAHEGAAVVATDLRGAPVGDAVAAATRNGGKAVAIEADVTSSADWDRAVAEAVDRFGGLDVLVNNAGIEGEVAPVTEYNDAVFRKVLDVNVLGVFLGTRAAAPRIVQRGGGSIVNISSIAGLTGTPGTAAYTASKHAVIGLTRTSALELGPQGVRVNAVCPAPVEGRMMRSLEAGMAPDDPEALRRMIATNNPLGRYGEPADVAALIAFLASDDAAYLNGAALPVDGGVTAR